MVHECDENTLNLRDKAQNMVKLTQNIQESSRDSKKNMSKFIQGRPET